MMKRWYNSDDKKSRIISEWQSMTLSMEKSESRTESEDSVFRNFEAQFRSLQKKLDKTYHTDIFLIDRLLTAVDIPSIQTTLKDTIPKTIQDTVNRFTNQLSDKSNTAGSNSSCFVKFNKGEVLISLGKSYGGDERRDIYVYKKTRMKYRKPEGSRLFPEWMKGVKGCFLCVADHRAKIPNTAKRKWRRPSTN